MSERTEGALDLARCEAEPIHAIDAVQDPFALLILCPRRGIVLSASANLAELLDVPIESLAGAPVAAVFAGPDALPALDPDAPLPRNRAPTQPAQLAGGRLVLVTPFAAGPWQGLLIDPDTDPEREEPQPGIDALMQFNALLEAELARDDPDAETMGRAVATTFRALSGFDRAMVYRFDADLNGTVIAEARAPSCGVSYLGLTYPSSDIPRPARALFLRNRARPVVDIESPPHRLIHLAQETRETGVDLGDCPERAVSPIHVDYLRAMGVRATLTVSIVVRGRLWGLLACHHGRSRRLPVTTMRICRALCEMLSQAFTRLEERRLARARDRLAALGGALRRTALDAAGPASLQTVLDAHARDVLDVLDGDGLAWVQGRVGAMLGDGPDAALRDAILDHGAEWCRTWNHPVFATDRLSDHAPHLAAHAGSACAGLMSGVQAAGDAQMMVWRRARPTPVTWAGDPRKRVTADGPLGPRASFEAWAETQTDRAAPWLATDRETFGLLGALLAEIALIVERRAAERRAAEAHALVEEARAALAHSAVHDPLTGLLNRAGASGIVDARRTGPGPVATLAIGLERVDTIADLFGQAMADALLVRSAATIRHHAGADDVLARTGANGFALIVEAESGRDAVEAMASRILAAVARPVCVGGETVSAGAGIGIAFDEGGRLAGDALLARAELALAESRRAGPGQVRVATDAMEAAHIARQRTARDIEAGMASGAFSLLYQPQFDARSLRIAGAEALLRWRHPSHGLLTPDRFLDAAEEIGALERIDAFVVAQAMADLERWRAAGLDVPGVSVNLSARRLRDPALAAFLRNQTVAPGSLTFELLESIDLERIDTVSRGNLDAIRRAGIHVEIDDFGTGRTSIMNLVVIRPDRLKVDGGLVGPIVDNPAARRLLEGVLDIARALGIAVTAEGVETDAHVAILRDLGVDRLQGYALSRPVGAAALAELAQERLGAVSG